MKRAIFVVLLAGLLILPAVARADFFDGEWYMGSSWWTKNTEGQGIDIEEYGYKLAVTGQAGTDGGYAEYRSNWGLKMDQDIAFSADFYYNPSATDTRLRIGLVPTGSTGLNGVNIGRGCSADGSTPIFYWEYDFGDPGTYNEIPEINKINEGTFSLNYNSLSHMLTMSVLGTDMSEGYDLSSVIGDDKLMSVYLGGSSFDSGTSIDENQMFFSNFKFTSGAPITPEPVSSALFLLGGGALVLRRYRRKK